MAQDVIALDGDLVMVRKAEAGDQRVGGVTDRKVAGLDALGEFPIGHGQVRVAPRRGRPPAATRMARAGRPHTIPMA
ncbi:hypothetical protein [Spongiactinospora sp. TRM90649]|uniref:hypothetical protein n=1 Tax=Spongiactinospora sp. TRM90649 TaxID=3031114 RepID=UPI0023F834A0|nr:hypothetical protein [Spongiactinospora sp. TRM90649]MDF5757116.1 hypothetical protein [Spongiactinospora sp. TRM90649]